MPELVKALTVRLFGTPQLVAESALVLTSLAVLLYLTPSILVFAVQAAFLALYYIAIYGFIGLFAGIIPGLIIGIGGPAVLLTLLILFCRGYVSVAIRYLIWLRHIYYLAQEDITLNAHFARHDGFEVTDTPTEPGLAQLHSQLADQERLIASLEGAIASKEEIISLLRGRYNRPN